MHLIDLIKAAFLGIIEGLTEFIPVSSTAHLLISSYLIDFNSISNNLFEIVIQVGAILAICVLYRQKLFNVLLNFKDRSQQKFTLNIILAFLPAAIIGLALYKFIKAYLFSNLVIAIALIIGGILMIIIDRPSTTRSRALLGDRSGDGDNIDNITPKTAFLIGLFQCFAMIPGVSRSGATIIGGLVLGLKRKVATEFSFFLAIPTIFAATIYDFYKNFSDLSFSNLELIIVGTLTSFVSAILIIKWFINFVSKHNFVSFGIYRIIVGILVLLFIV